MCHLGRRRKKEAGERGNNSKKRAAGEVHFPSLLRLMTSPIHPPLRPEHRVTFTEQYRVLTSRCISTHESSVLSAPHSCRWQHYNDLMWKVPSLALTAQGWLIAQRSAPTALAASAIGTRQSPSSSPHTLLK